MEKKGNHGLVVALILTIIIILGLVIYICYDKEIIFSNNDNVETENVKTNN